jgi:RNA polymerase sigma-70 factor (ECF subfamily)
MAEHNRASVAEPGLHLLVLRCQTGDERAFAQLMNQFGERSLRYLRGLIDEAAEDVQQEVWLTVYRGIAELANPRAFRTWLFRITRHRALDYLRSRKRERELMDDVPVDTLDSVAADSEHEGADIDAAMLDALDALPPAHREVCLLRYRDDMSYAEIALVIGCSIGTVRSRLHYAKQRLHEHVKHRR